MEHKLGDILNAVNGKLIAGDLSAEIKGFSIDSRQVSSGELFLAVKGGKFDGHDFVDAALQQGALGVIVSDVDKVKNKSADNIIQVDNTLDALKSVSSFIRDKAGIPFICVTGTNGKTTVKEILKQILSVKYKVLSSKRSFNNVFGVALTLFDLKPEHEVAILEIGTNSAGEISELAGIIEPDIGIITNIGYGHIEAFKDLRGVLREKTALLDHVKENGIAIMNKDDELLAEFIHGHCRIRYFGTVNGSDFFISGVDRKDTGYNFLINGQEFYLPVYGEHNIYNAAAAICASDHLKIDYSDMKKALEKVSLPEMRLSKLMVDNILFINDAYNANPSSFLSALNVVKYEVKAPKKGVVAGDMLELGESSKELHSHIGKRIAELDMDFLIGMGDGASIMVDAAVDAGMSKEKTKKVKSHKDAAVVLRKFADRESAVLLKGSRKSRMEDVVTCFMNCSIN